MSAPMMKNGLKKLGKHARLFMAVSTGTDRNQKILAVHTKVDSRSLTDVQVHRPVLLGHHNPLQQQVKHFGLSAPALSTTYVDLSDDDLHRAKNYLKSEDYTERYGDKPVWANYKRNFKGQVPPEKTRKMCIRGKGENRKVCANPCPICRDDDLLIDYRNIELLEQFICPHSWEIYSFSVTGVCQEQYKLLVKAIEKARSYGLIPYQVQHIAFEYAEYYKQEQSSRS